MEWAFHLLTLLITFMLVFCGYVHFAQMGRLGRLPPLIEERQPSYDDRHGSMYTGNIWLYTMVATDYGGDQLLRHFIDHYHGLGVPYDRFIFVLHHNPAYPDDWKSSYQRSVQFLRSNNFAFRNWVDQYSTVRAAARFLETTMEVITNPDSWVVRLDVDELLDTGGLLLRHIVTVAERENATYIEGSLVDRLSPGGILRQVRPEPHILEQFPTECLVEQRYAGPRERIVAFKAFLRPDHENHRVVPPRYALQYFSACKEAEAMPLESGIYKDCFGSDGTEPAKLEGHFHLTPYALYPTRYEGPEWKPRRLGQRPWRAQAFSRTFRVHHVKWHSGIVANLRDRAAFYRGDCNVNFSALGQQQCTPRHADWRQAIQAYYMVSGTAVGVDPTVPCTAESTKNQPVSRPVQADGSQPPG